MPVKINGKRIICINEEIELSKVEFVVSHFFIFLIIVSKVAGLLPK